MEGMLAPPTCAPTERNLGCRRGSFACFSLIPSVFPTLSRVAASLIVYSSHRLATCSRLSRSFLTAWLVRYAFLLRTLLALDRAKYGSEVEDAFQMEQRSITKQLNEIKSALQKGKPMQRWESAGSSALLQCATASFLFFFVFRRQTNHKRSKRPDTCVYCSNNRFREDFPDTGRVSPRRRP